MKEIKLTQGKVALIDDEDLELVSKYKWCAKKSGNTFYAYNSAYKDGRQYSLPMHRLLMGLKKQDKLFVDHINHNGLDNRRSNIRVCNNSQNQQNRHKKQNCTSKYKGVHLHRDVYYSKATKTTIRRNPRWVASIVIDGKKKVIGHYQTEIDAAIAYNEFAHKHHGEFAMLNDISDLSSFLTKKQDNNMDESQAIKEIENYHIHSKLTIGDICEHPDLAIIKDGKEDFCLACSKNIPKQTNFS